MWKFQPFNCLLWVLPMVGLTALAAFQLNTKPLNAELARRVDENLAAVNAAWAKPVFDGRDAILNSDAPSQAAIDLAAEAIRKTYGVRTLKVGSRVVEPIVMLPAVKWNRKII